MTVTQPARTSPDLAVPSATRSASLMAEFRPGEFALRDAWFPVIQLPYLRRRGLARRTLHGQPVFAWWERGTLRVTEDSPSDIERGRRRASEFTGASGDWPVIQRYGYAWVWYGDPDNASSDLMPTIPYIPDGGMPRRMMGNVVFDCSYELVNENLLDLTHADFLHSALTGDPLSDEDEISVTSTSETVTMVRRAIHKPTPTMQRRITKSDYQDQTLVTLVHVRSGLCLLHGNFDPGMSVRMIHPCTPETPNRCRTAVSFNVQKTTKIARAVFPIAAHIVGRQDNWALAPQNPLYRRSEIRDKDMNSRFDAAGVRYRKVYSQLVERQKRGDFSYLPDGDPQRDIREEMNFPDLL